MTKNFNLEADLPQSPSIGTGAQVATIGRHVQILDLYGGKTGPQKVPITAAISGCVDPKPSGCVEGITRLVPGTYQQFIDRGQG